MLLPIGDRPNLPETPWITWGLIAINMLVFVTLWPLSLQPVAPEDPTTAEYFNVLQAERGVSLQAMLNHTSRADVMRYRWGNKPAQLSLLTLFTSMFLHGGFMHLAGNMLFLWIFGDNVEHRLGRLGFLLAYLATGVAASLGDTLLRLGSSIPSVGASGAISGVLGLYFLWFPRNRVRVFAFLFPILMNVIELPARWVLGFYLVVDNLLPLLVSGGGGGISYGAHIGGFVAGVALAGFLAGTWRTPRRGGAGPRIGRSKDRPPDASQVAETLRRLLAEGRLEDASELFFSVPGSVSRQVIPPVDKLALAEALAAADQHRPALAAYQRLLSEHPRGPGRVRAHLGAARLMLHAFGSPTAAYQHLYSALEENPTPDEATEGRQLLQELEGRTRGLPRRPKS